MVRMCGGVAFLGEKDLVLGRSGAVGGCGGWNYKRQAWVGKYLTIYLRWIEDWFAYLELGL